MSAPVVDPFDLARAEVLLFGYDARWLDEMRRYEVLGVEQEFSAPLRNPETGASSRTWALAGKLDVLVRDLEDGLVKIVEHKHTTQDAGPGSDYIKRLRLDGQVTTYYAGAQAAGHDVAGCVYDVLVKPGQRPYRATPEDARKYTKGGQLYANQHDKDETPEEFRARLVPVIAAEPNDYFLRAQVTRLEDEMREGMADIWETARAMRDADLARRHPRNPDACVRYGRTCEFFGVCTGEASLQDPALFVRSDVTHPELAQYQRDGALLTTSRMSAFRACPRLHKLRYLDGYRPAVEANTLRFGTLVHKGLEAWWKAEEDTERLPRALEALRGEDQSH